MNTPIRIKTVVIVCALGTLFAGCASSRRERFQSRLEEERKSIPPMEAQDTFFDGRIDARVTLNGGLGGGPLGRARRGGGFHPKFAGVQAGGGAGGYGGGYGGGMEPDTELPPPDREDIAPQLNTSPMPPVVLELSVHNTSTEPLEVEFIDFTSELGDFAVRPATLKLAPGETAAPDAMTSRLGLTSYALPITVALRVGDKTERKVLTLHPQASDNASAPRD